MRARRLIALPAAAVLAAGLLGACNDTEPAEEPAGTMSPEDTMEEDTMEEDTMEEDTMEDEDTMEEDTMEDEDSMEEDTMEDEG